MKTGIELALDQLTMEEGLRFRIDNIMYDKTEASLCDALQHYLRSPSLVVVWQMQSIIWGRWQDGALVWADFKDVFAPGWLEVRAFNEMEELHLREYNGVLKGRYLRDGDGSETVSYVDSFSRLWGQVSEKTASGENGFVILEDDERKIQLCVPYDGMPAKWLGLQTRNYVGTEPKTGQSGYVDYRFVKISSADAGAVM